MHVQRGAHRRRRRAIQDRRGERAVPVGTVRAQEAVALEAPVRQWKASAGLVACVRLHGGHARDVEPRKHAIEEKEPQRVHEELAPGAKVHGAATEPCELDVSVRKVHRAACEERRELRRPRRVELVEARVRSRLAARTEIAVDAKARAHPKHRIARIVGPGGAGEGQRLREAPQRQHRRARRPAHLPRRGVGVRRELGVDAACRRRHREQRRADGEDGQRAATRGR